MSQVKEQSGGASLGDIASIIGAVGGLIGDKKTKTTTSGGKTTTGLDISQQGVDKMIADILASNSGLAAVTSGQKQAGLYNSSTNQLLVNDLLDRTTSSVARDTAKTVTTTAPQTQTSVQEGQFGLGEAALGLGGAMLANKVLKEVDFGDVFGSIGDIFGMGGGAETAGTVASSLGGISDISSFVGGADMFGGMPYMSMFNSFVSGEPEDALASGAGFMIGNALLPGIGGPIGAMITGDLPIGDIVSGAGDLLGGIFGGGSVVCTELLAQGLMRKTLYATDIHYAANHMSKETLDGYRYWGIPLVKLMRKSPKVTAVVAWFAVARAHYIASLYSGTFYEDKLARRGKVINTIGVPICNLIAAFTTPKDYKSLYPLEVFKFAKV